MAHINDLSPKVLYRILCLASGPPAKDIDKWKPKLTLLQVCTKWYDLFKSYVFSQGFVGIYSLRRNENPYINMKSCVYYSDSDIVCRSNLEIITGRSKYNCDCVSQLIIGIDRILNIGMYGYILKSLSALGIGYWLNMTSLTFNSTLRFPPPIEPAQQNLEELSATVSKYIHDFQYRIPNITHLLVVIQEDRTLITSLYILVNLYAPQLQYLHFYYPIERQILPPFSAELTSLLLNMGTSTCQHPTFYAKSLQYLNLINISSKNFSWRAFHDFATPGRIEFSNLTTLHLTYGNQTDEEKKLSEKYSKQARPYGSHMLQFPKLKSLTTMSSPVDCDVFYTDIIPTHLEKLNFQGSCDSFVASTRLRFTNVNNLTIVLHKNESLVDDFYIAADRYFGYTRIGNTCEVILHPQIDAQQTVSWVNVTDLWIYNIEPNELLKFVTNLYNLRKLTVINIRLDDELLAFVRLGLEEEVQGKFELLDTRLEHLSFYSIKAENPHQLLAILNHLFLRIKTLKTFRIDKIQGLILEKSFLPGKFPQIKIIS